MNRIKKITVSLIVFVAIVAPIVSFAADGLIPCGTKANPTMCDFYGFMSTINIIIHFILFKLAIPIAAIMFFYAGFELVISGGSTEKRGTAKKVFTNTLIGLILAMAGWLIVRTIISILGFKGAWIGF